MSDTTTKLIQPAPVQRDECGNWWHPDVPEFEGSDEAGPDAPKWKDWMREQGLEYCRFSLEDEDESHPVYQSYFEAEDPSPDFSKWEPKPDGDGWFMLAICDTEDGPQAWFARRVTQEVAQ